jgi:hypothetical protein
MESGLPKNAAERDCYINVAKTHSINNAARKNILSRNLAQGIEAALKTKGPIRNVMQILFEWAMHWPPEVLLAPKFQTIIGRNTDETCLDDPGSRSETPNTMRIPRIDYH